MGNLVFTHNGKPVTVPKLRKAFENAVANAGIEGFRFKDLRHTAKTRWAKMASP